MTERPGSKASGAPLAEGSGGTNEAPAPETMARRPSAASQLEPGELELAWRLARLYQDRLRLVVAANEELRRDLPDAVCAETETVEEGRG